MLLTHSLRMAQKSSLIYVGGKSSSPGDSATPSITITGLTGGAGSAPQSNDFVIVAIAVQNTGSDIDIQCSTAGYTELVELRNAPGELAVFYKLLTSAETSIAFSLPAPDYSVIACQVWRGIDLTTPQDATRTTATTVDGYPNPPSITTVTNNAVVIAIGSGIADNDKFPSAFLVPSGMQNLVSVRNGNVSGNQALGVAIASINRPTAGSYNPSVFSVSGGDTDGFDSCAITMALRPKP